MENYYCRYTRDALNTVIWTIMHSGSCLANTESRTYFKGSSKRTVAAQWKTILTRVRSSSSSSALMASLGWVSSALIGLIFSWKLGQSSRTLSKTLKHKETEIKNRIRLLKSLWLVAGLITSIYEISTKENPRFFQRWHTGEISLVSFQGENFQGKQNKNTGGNVLPQRDEWIFSRPLIS